MKRGDIIVFRYPVDITQTFVKRCMGVPGDRIRIVNKQVYLNGVKLDEPYKVNKTDYIDSYRDNFPGEPNVSVESGAIDMLKHHVVNGEVVVPPNYYFAMGDNRDSSLDSRYWGFVPRENIIGKPLIIYWSYDAPTDRVERFRRSASTHVFDLAKNFFPKTRWRRTFMLIHGYPIKRTMKNFVDSTRDFINEWTLNILILLFGTTTLVQAFIVPTPSMDTTVLVGDHLLVDKLSYAPPDSISQHLLPYTEPKRGDIIVFRYPDGHSPELREARDGRAGRSHSGGEQGRFI